MEADTLFESILRARVYHLAQKTALDHAPLLSKRLNNRVYLKREDQQPVFSFKLRGAANKIAQMSTEARAAGVVAASAGNHAQGVAMAARKMEIQATIVMPLTTPGIKVRAVKRLGGPFVTVELVGENYDEAYAHMRTIAESRGATVVHPYDDLEIIAGQGTVAVEILSDLPAPHAIFVPVGGGGLLAGVVAFTKRLYPETLVIGVEPEDAASMHAALQAGRPVPLKEVGIFADGVAVRTAGTHTFDVVHGLVDGIVTVTTDEICAALKDVYEDTRVVAEPAGALSVAGLNKWAEANDVTDAELVAIVSGANMNFDRLRHVAERAGLGDRSELLLAVTIPERPGAFLEFCETIGRRAITEFNYRYSQRGDAHIFVGVEARGESERTALIAELRNGGYAVTDLTDDELAKLHIRHLVGGRSPDVGDERLFRFIFPERPGALLRFLRQMKPTWNVSLFHYRNHGAAYGRVLAGFQLTDADAADFEGYLSGLGYQYAEETENPAYRLFLSGAKTGNRARR